MYCLPDDYEVHDASLADIRHQLAPRYTKADIKSLDRRATYARALDGDEFLPGLVGLNTPRGADGITAALELLLRVRSLRNYW